MSRKRCEIFLRIVVYYVIFSNITLPILLLLFAGPSSCITISDLLTCVVWIVSGVLLLIGTVQGKEVCVRIYVLLTTICLLIAPIYLGVFSGGTDRFACENRNTVTIILLLLYFIMMWPFQYCVYLFYKQMAQSAQTEEEEEESHV